MMMVDLLNRSQKSWLAIVLRTTEEAMARIREITKLQDAGRLYALTNDLTSGEIRDLLKLAQEVDNIVIELDERFGFQREVRPISHVVRAELSLLWEALEDNKAEKLHRFGEIDPHLRQVLDPPLERLVQLILTMERIADQASGRGPER